MFLPFIKSYAYFIHKRLCIKKKYIHFTGITNWFLLQHFYLKAWKTFIMQNNNNSHEAIRTLDIIWLWNASIFIPSLHSYEIFFFFKRGLEKRKYILHRDSKLIFNTLFYLFKKMRYILYKTTLSRPLVLSKSYDCEMVNFSTFHTLLKNDLWISHPNDTW